MGCCMLFNFSFSYILQMKRFYTIYVQIEMRKETKNEQGINKGKNFRAQGQNLWIQVLENTKRKHPVIIQHISI
jgi:hypothetical protein